VLSHLRKGRPGDWRNHFTRKQAELFEQTWPKFLSRTGYEVDDQWPREIDGRKSSQDPEDATSVVSTLLRQRCELETRLHQLAATCEAKEAVIRELAAACEARLDGMKKLAAELERLQREGPA
jgi:DNA-binding FadR family transcriptional regulator